MKPFTSRRILALALLAPILLLACTRKDLRVVHITVPEMASELDVRIVTNAALNEVAGHYAGKFRCEVDVNRGLVLYHEGTRLLGGDFQRRIVQCLAQVGYPAQLLAVRHNPPAPIRFPQGLVQDWPDRVTAVISIPKLRNNRDARRVEDAIGYARSGDTPALAADRTARALAIAYDGRLTGLKNIEHAIATAGYAANDTPAEPDQAGGIPIGWSPVSLN